MADEQTAPKPDHPPVVEPPDDKTERDYIVFTRAELAGATEGEGWREVTRGRFKTKQAALDAAYEKLPHPNSGDPAPVTLVACPAHFWKPVVVRVTTVKQVKWEDT